MSTTIPPYKNNRTTLVELHIFPDSGPSICLARPNFLKKLNIKNTHLIPCYKNIKAVDGSILICHGMLPVKFDIGSNTTIQNVYICDKVSHVYLSKAVCKETHIILSCFPHPMSSQEDTIAAVNNTQVESPMKTKPTPTIPQKPQKLLYPATEANVPKLEQYLKDAFKDTAFNRSPCFPAMTSPLTHIHLKPDAIPYAQHTPIPVPYNWKDQIKASLDQDIARGIIAPVPMGTPVTWCSPMVITTKKDGTPCRTIDLQCLNSQCHCETCTCLSPFQLACQIPQNTKKTVLDDVDGYHTVELDTESQELTTFSTEWVICT